MLNKVFLLLLVIYSQALHVDLCAQIAKEFTVVEREGYGLVALDFSCYKGITHVRREHSGNPVHASAELGKVNILPSFSHHITDGVLFAYLDHKNVESESLGRSLSYRLFSNSDENFDHHWKLGLDANFLYDLNLNFGIGKANLDFSHLPISNCKIRTASADVVLGYLSKIPNTVNMDTLSVVINMGSLYADDLQFSNAHKTFLDVKYGTINLSFSDLMAQPSIISATVGAGSVNIKLPETKHPYIVKIKNHAMCKTSIPPFLKEMDDKSFVSKGYSPDAKNLMTFLIDVSVGSVSLK
ncbi:hypothetical protein [Lunatibacter salilacus]|uniref:hypothetical protein n=1 Tax=Lunatibacter salilacus TaxID=2483804 RepID=UPI0018FE6D6C|nr:hypothetical protein [Lunatibacter salilacus]